MRAALALSVLILAACAANSDPTVVSYPKVRETPAMAVLDQPGPAGSTALGLDAIVTTQKMIPFTFANTGTQRLETLIVAPRDARAGDRRPAIVITHGNGRDPKSNRSLRLHRYGWLAQEFARRGYIAMVLARRGFGGSEGEYDEWYGRCDTVDADGYVAAGLRGAEDLRRALTWLGKDPRVDPDRLLALGQSGGGFAALAMAADPPDGLRGVINFSGGRGSIRDGENCNGAALTAAFGRFGTADAAPSLWLYSIRDKFFGPELVNAHFEAIQSPTRLVMLGPIHHAEDGHRLFQRGNTMLWRPAIDDFLGRIGMPTWERAPDDPHDQNLPPPDGLSDKGRKAWREFLGSEMNRAFAIGPGQKFGWASAYAAKTRAIDKALLACSDAPDICEIYMLNETLQ